MNGIVEAFIDNLTSELSTLEMSASAIKQVVYRVDAFKDGTPIITGTGGYRLYYGFMPALFVVVGDAYQGHGYGQRRVKKIIDMAMSNNTHLITLSTYERPEYAAANHIYRKCGFRERYRQGDKVHYTYIFDLTGRVISFLLPVINFTAPLLIGLKNKYWSVVVNGHS